MGKFPASFEQRLVSRKNACTGEEAWRNQEAIRHHSLSLSSVWHHLHLIMLLVLINDLENVSMRYLASIFLSLATTWKGLWKKINNGKQTCLMQFTRRIIRWTTRISLPWFLRSWMSPQDCRRKHVSIKWFWSTSISLTDPSERIEFARPIKIRSTGYFTPQAEVANHG